MLVNVTHPLVAVLLMPISVPLFLGFGHVKRYSALRGLTSLCSAKEWTNLNDSWYPLNILSKLHAGCTTYVLRSNGHLGQVVRRRFCMNTSSSAITSSNLVGGQSFFFGNAGRRGVTSGRAGRLGPFPPPARSIVPSLGLVFLLLVDWIAFGTSQQDSTW